MTIDEMSGAVFDRSRRYRWLIWRRWDATKPMLNYISLNPSIAGECFNDPTVARYIQRTQRLGYGGFYGTNAFSHIGTDFTEIEYVAQRGIDIVGIENDHYILKAARDSAMIICGWGPKPAALRKHYFKTKDARAGVKLFDRHQQMLELLEGFNLYCLRKTVGGYPEHPLYLPYHLQPIVYRESMVPAA